MKFVATAMKYSVHVENENPVFGGTAIHVSLDDEGAGAYLVLEQADEEKPGVIRLEIEQLEEVLNVAKTLIAGAK